MITTLSTALSRLAEFNEAVAVLELDGAAAVNVAIRDNDLVPHVEDLRTLQEQANDVARRVTRLKHAVEARISNLRTAA